MRRSIFLSLILCFVGSGLFAEIKGKVDVGPAYVRLDLLKSGKTVKRLDMGAVKADALFCINKGFTVKPSILIARNGGELDVYSLGIGQYIPLNKTWAFLPQVGFSYTEMRSRVDLGIKKEKQVIRSASPFFGIEVYYTINCDWLISAQYLYAFSRSRTKIGDFHLPKERSAGPSYALLVEYTLNKNWTVNLGAAYNITLSKEKHGIRGAGVKAGAAYWW